MVPGCLGASRDGGQVKRPPSRGPRVGRHWARRRDRADGVVWWALRCYECGEAGPWALTQAQAVLDAYGAGWSFYIPLTPEGVLCCVHAAVAKITALNSCQRDSGGGR